MHYKSFNNGIVSIKIATSKNLIAEGTKFANYIPIECQEKVYTIRLIINYNALKFYDPIYIFQNSGLTQGRIVRRNKIPKTALGDYWHWKDLNIGIDIGIYGVVYHIVNCDNFTKVSKL